MIISILIWLATAVLIVFTHYNLHSLLFLLFIIPVCLIAYFKGALRALTLSIITLFFIFVYLFNSGQVSQNMKVLGLISLVFLLLPFAADYLFIKTRNKKAASEASSEPGAAVPAEDKTAENIRQYEPRIVEQLLSAISQKYVHEAYHIIFEEINKMCEISVAALIKKNKAGDFEIDFNRNISDTFRVGKKFTDAEREFIEGIVGGEVMQFQSFADELQLESKYPINYIAKADDRTAVIFQLTKEPECEYIAKSAGLVGAINYFFDLKNEISRRVSIDEKTNILHYHVFHSRLTDELERVRRYNTNFGIAFLELENYYKVVRIKGYLYSEQFIEKLKEVIGNAVRRIDYVTSVEKNKYIILFPQTDEAGLKTVVERVIQKVQQALKQEVDTEEIYMSCGIVFVRNGDISAEGLVDKAQQLMLEARRKGPNSVELAEFA